MILKVGTFLRRLFKSNSRKYFKGAILIGFVLSMAVAFSTTLSVTSAKGHPVRMLTDINDDGNLDILMNNGKILVSDGEGQYLSNEITFENGIPAQRTYSLTNSTLLPDDESNTFYNISYLVNSNGFDTDRERSIFLITPGNMTATIFNENEDGVFNPTITITLKNDTFRNLLASFENRVLNVV